VKEFFGDSVIQRCLIHKKRNVKGNLFKCHWGEVSRLCTRLRGVQGIAAAEKVPGEPKPFLEPINAEAYRSLNEAAEDRLALHRLNVSNTLHRSLLSTNAIENSFLKARRKSGRVTRFRAETDQGPSIALAVLRVAGSGEGLSSNPRSCGPAVVDLGNGKTKKLAGQKTPYGTN
jgi:transposase-like protein